MDIHICNNFKDPAENRTFTDNLQKCTSNIFYNSFVKSFCQKMFKFLWLYKYDVQSTTFLVYMTYVIIKQILKQIKHNYNTFYALKHVELVKLVNKSIG